MTQEINEKVIRLFLRTELRDGEEVVDNRDSVIAKELGIKTKHAEIAIRTYLSDHFNKLNKL